ncbi:MAG: L,D-transpeptidase family protein [Clostridiales bacterium]|nr:L,D-transpeptidase family protein [Clostridiales bacterium]
MIIYIIISCLHWYSTGNAGSFDLDENTGFHIPETGCALYIDLDAYTMTVYQNGQVYKTFPVSGGVIETPSPVGTWQVTEVSDWGGGFGGSWIGLNVPWGSYGIHGTEKPWLVGRGNVSHGCIRMKNKDAFEIRELVSVGTVVHIKHDALPFRNMRKDVRGSDVLNTQILLKRLGFYTGAIDGIFGSGMTYAVKSFQKTYHLPIDGVVRRVTYEKIVEQERTLPQLDRNDNTGDYPCNAADRAEPTPVYVF